MHLEQSHPNMLISITLNVMLATISTVLGFTAQVDLYLDIIAKLIAIGAGLATIFLAYKNYKAIKK